MLPEWELEVLLGQRTEDDDEDDGSPDDGAVLVGGEPVEPPVPEGLKGL